MRFIYVYFVCEIVLAAMPHGITRARICVYVCTVYVCERVISSYAQEILNGF